MIRRRILYSSLLCATALAGTTLTQPAFAQSAAQINAIEQQIKALQSQLGQLKAQVSKRDHELKAAQQQAREAQQRAQAAQEQAASVQAAQQQQAAQIAAVAPPAPEQPPLPKGSFRVGGGLTVTLGGFVAAEGAYRTRNEGVTINSTFGGIPLRNSPNYYVPETRLTAQQSRLSMLVQGDLSPTQKVTGYVETDFLSAGSSSNSTESNSYTLRFRQFWGSYDNTDYGLHFLGGQAWSLATLYRVGLVPRQENVPLTIDAQYVVGFNWARQAQFRIAKDFDDHKVWLGLSAESPQTTFGSSAGPNCLTGAQATTPSGITPQGTLNYTSCGGSNENSVYAYSDNIAPDIIAKLAMDPGYGHYEVYGLLRFLGGRVSYASTGTGKNYWTTGQGIGGGMILPVVAKKLDFQLSGLVGQGVGRYASGLLPDATFSQQGQIAPLTEYSILGGLVAHPMPSLDVYAYGGAEGVMNKPYGTNGGYGNPNFALGGCNVELGSCSANTSGLLEGTVGAWWRMIRSDYGTLQVGAQYEYINRNTFQGVFSSTNRNTLSPSTNENMFLVSFRYLPFQ
ncbi:FlxA-like family protein [Rhodopila globiformis]|uniref:Porin n=1 Tax=Rhodopila globiformis TaxID=1071 RepID=A0A2S6NJH0_RHOGL|nr:FlxA-like family protein [Rhodopila globiformis]PPQ34984.1 hypothetical protein CCS01_09160 [Rhodopila globiformis]